MRKVQIYVENQLIDLFQDEQIKVKSQAQDINDISKTLTDYSQTFSIPASKVNNTVFGYYYNNDLGTFNANTRLDCRIEIDYVPFRTGKLQLEGSTIKNNKASSYKVGFFGDVTSLKDLFGEDKLLDLDYSSIEQAHTGAIVQSSIETTTHLDVRYPLISSERIWGALTMTNIGNAIVWDELFPAITDSAIFSIIEAKYGVTFTGDFLDDPRFLASYTFWKNRETTDFVLAAVDLEFNALDTACNVDLPDAVGVNLVNVKYIDVNLIATPVGWSSWVNTFITIPKHTVQVTITPATTVLYYLDFYKNGSKIFSFSNSTTDTFTVVFDTPNLVSLNNELTFKVRSVAALTFDFDIDYIFRAPYLDTSNVLQEHELTCTYSETNISIINLLDFNFTAPDMKVVEWFTGTLKQFDLTCYPTSPLTYEVVPIPEWYAAGEVIDVTPYVITDEIKVDRAKMYNEISFGWQDSKSFMNEAFLGFNNRDYGSLKNIFPNNDGGKYEVKLPFETLLFNNYDTINNNLQVAYCLTNPPDYKPYVPKPIKLYLQSDKTIQLWFDNGSTVPQLTNYMPFGQDTIFDSENYSINFGDEISSLLLTNVSKSLYQTYYEAYLTNLFNPKTRIITVKVILPLTTLTSLTLDDKIIIRSKAYRINSMDTNLTTGIVKLVLISDWTQEATSTFAILLETGDYLLQETGFKILL
jgi:hypothetical protein